MLSSPIKAYINDSINNTIRLWSKGTSNSSSNSGFGINPEFSYNSQRLYLHMGTFIAYLVLKILSFVAQSKRESIKKAPRRGHCRCQSAGLHLGRAEVVQPSGFPEIVRALDAGEITIEEALKSTGMSIATFYRRSREHKLMNSGAK